MPAQMHCHSIYSVDAQATPEELVAEAAGRGVTFFSLTDHNSFAGLPRARAKAEEMGLEFISGVEIDVKNDQEDLHALAFGFDPENAELLRICDKNFSQYAINFEPWIPFFEKRFGVTRQQLQDSLADFYPGLAQPVLNKWYARAYLLINDILPDRETALREMSAIGTQAEGHLPNSEVWPFCDLSQTVDAVHRAGGVILLAHVGSFRQTLKEQLQLVRKMLDAGFDGFELYHPGNTRYEHFEKLAAEARNMDCALSGGTDSHSVLPAGTPDPTGRPKPSMPPVPDWVVEALRKSLAERRQKEKLDC
jgi:3',5'-nucleoside bisphosphate phosphatase